MFWSVEQVLLIKEERDLLEIGSLNLQVATSSAQFLLRQFTQTERKRLGTFSVVFFEIKINDGLSRERERGHLYCQFTSSILLSTIQQYKGYSRTLFAPLQTRNLSFYQIGAQITHMRQTHDTNVINSTFNSVIVFWFSSSQTWSTLWTCSLVWTRKSPFSNKPKVLPPNKARCLLETRVSETTWQVSVRTLI